MQQQHEQATAPIFTMRERLALEQLRRRYRVHRDLFSAQEKARLRYLRWLIATGRLVP